MMGILTNHFKDVDRYEDIEILKIRWDLFV